MGCDCMPILAILNMQECGPRFTLKLTSLQHGTFDSKGGEFEWVHKVVNLPTKSGHCLDLIYNLYIFQRKKNPLNFSDTCFVPHLIFSRKWTRAEGGFSCDALWSIAFMFLCHGVEAFSGEESWYFETRC